MTKKPTEGDMGGTGQGRQTPQSIIDEVLRLVKEWGDVRRNRRKIARHVGVSHTTVQRILKRNKA